MRRPLLNLIRRFNSVSDIKTDVETPFGVIPVVRTSSLINLIDSNRWDLVWRKRKKYYSYDKDEFKIDILPIITRNDIIKRSISDGIGVFSDYYIDTEIAEVVNNEIVLKHNVGYESDVPTIHGEYIYRGMCFEEMQFIRSTGYIASHGEYNLGEEEVGVTYFTTDIDTAHAYANAFQPFMWIATFDRPGYIIAIDMPPEYMIDKKVSRGDEVAVRGRLRESLIRHVIELRPLFVRPGYMEVNYDYAYGLYYDGTRIGARAGCVYRLIR